MIKEGNLYRDITNGTIIKLVKVEKPDSLASVTYERYCLGRRISIGFMSIVSLKNKKKYKELSVENFKEMWD